MAKYRVISCGSQKKISLRGDTVTLSQKLEIGGILSGKICMLAILAYTSNCGVVLI